MSQAEKAAYWRELKDAGVEFKLHYREYSTDQLAAAVQRLREGQAAPAPAVAPPPSAETVNLTTSPPDLGAPQVKHATPDTMAGIRQNTVAPDEPIRTDENGFVWFQDEVRKPAFPKPRGRRVIKYTDPGVKTVTLNGSRGESESFEMPGDESRAAEARITLPGYQVGIYQDPRYPFKIHVYNEERGFDLFEVEKFWGGADLVPKDVKRKYVSSTLCYDMRTTIRQIEAEAAQLALQGKL